MGILDWFKVNKSNSSRLTEERREWIESTLSWLVEAFGFDEIKQSPFILPLTSTFPYTDLSDTSQFNSLFDQVCKYWDLNPQEIDLIVFDDLKSFEFQSFRFVGELDETAGFFTVNEKGSIKKYRVEIARSILKDPQLCVAVLSHELAHVKLIGGGFIEEQTNELEFITDITSIYFGFGVFAANSTISQTDWGLGRVCYLNEYEISYCNAMLCYLSEYEFEKLLPFLNTNTKELLVNELEFLKQYGPITLTKERVEMLNQCKQIGVLMDDAFYNKEWDLVLKLCRQYLSLNEDSYSILNYAGLAYVYKRDYLKAIDSFSKSIKIHPYFDLALVNRGFCRLMINDLESGYNDIEQAFKFNNKSIWCSRNFGIYYFMTEAYSEALEMFRKVEEIDEWVELNNFMLSQTYFKLNNLPESHKYWNKHLECNDVNSTIFEDLSFA